MQILQVVQPFFPLFLALIFASLTVSQSSTDLGSVVKGAPAESACFSSTDECLGLLFMFFDLALSH